MTNEEKAKELSYWHCNEKSCCGHECKNCSKAKIDDAVMQMAKWKDNQPINELGGWHTEEPTEDGWYLVDTPDFPKNCHCIVAEWDNDAKHFYSESSDSPVDFEKWKLIEMR